MKTLAPLVWMEGMALDPHHLQYLDRFHLGIVNARAMAASPNSYGFVQLRTDEAALENETLALSAATGFLPDGTPFDMPGSDATPTPREVGSALGPGVSHLDVYLCLPIHRPEGANVQNGTAAGGRAPRYLRDKVRIGDDTRLGAEREVEIARGNFTLRFGSESRDDVTSLQIARLRRAEQGKVRVDERFVPTCLDMRASSWLLELSSQMRNVIGAKVKALWGPTRASQSGSGLTHSDIANLLNLDAAHVAIARIVHLEIHGAHPEQLFLEMLTLAARLCTLPDSGIPVNELPKYDHGRPTESFSEIEEALRTLLAAEVRSGVRSIRLERSEAGMYRATFAEDRTEGRALFLMIRGELDMARVSTLAQRIRVAAPSRIDAVLASMSSATPLEYQARPPQGAPAASDVHYLKIATGGDFRADIDKERAIAVLATGELDALSYELLIAE